MGMYYPGRRWPKASSQMKGIFKGPMLRQAIQGLHGARIQFPHRPKNHRLLTIIGGSSSPAYLASLTMFLLTMAMVAWISLM